MYKVVFLNSHPIQYFVPLYQQIAADKQFDIEVLYCSDETVKGGLDKEFGKDIKWDIPLLDAYKYKFLKNNSFSPSLNNGFWGLLNLSVIPYLIKKEKITLIIHGWGYATNVLSIIVGKLMGHTICLRSETPFHQEKMKNKVITYLKHLYLRFLFLFIDKFLFIGQQNKLFYTSLGVKESKLVFTPYCVDNNRFQQIDQKVSKQKAREKLGLPKGVKIILYSGKYINKKRPLDLINGFKNLNLQNTFLVMVGDGEMRSDMEDFIRQYNLTDCVLLTGFINQSLIPYYYCASDVFIMCSGLGETWGLTVNEAMNFGMPCIVSETCGCSYDLIEEGLTGFVFETGNILQLGNKINQALLLSLNELEGIKKRVKVKMEEYSYRTIISSLLSINNNKN